MTGHAYPFEALLGDYVRAALGFVLTVVPLATLDVGVWIGAVLAVLAVLFAIFGIRTMLRQASRIEVSETGIAASGPGAARIAWQDLDAVKLGYYATRRDGKNGWMQLAIGGGGKRITVDSRIDGFDAIVERTAHEAKARGVAVGATTAANFAALGLDLAAGGAR